jgi:uncharacterized cupin superfamily protein
VTDVVNVFADDWEEIFPPTEGWRSNMRRLAPQRTLGATLYELLPGQTQCPYHFHHGSEELVVVLSGRPALRTPDGERELHPGDAVHFPTGPQGAHQLINRTDEPARYVIAAANVSPEVIEYPDSGKVAAASREHRFRTVQRLEGEVDYFDGEQPQA